MSSSKIVLNSASGVSAGLREPIIGGSDGYGDNEYPNNFFRMKSDKFGNVYAFFRASSAGFIIQKFSGDDMSLEWSKTFSANFLIYQILISDDGSSVYLLGTESSRIQILEIDPDGVLQNSNYTRAFGGLNYGSLMIGAHFDASGKIAVMHTGEYDGTGTTAISLLNTSTFGWDSIQDIANAYDVVSYKQGPTSKFSAQNALSTSDGVLVLKHDSNASGRYIDIGGSASLRVRNEIGFCKDPLHPISNSTDLFLACDYWQSGSRSTAILSIDYSDWSLNWGKRFATGTTLCSAMDSKDNLYVLSQDRASTANDQHINYFVQKFNASGTREWLRTIQVVSNPADDDDNQGEICITPGDESFVVAVKGNNSLIVGRFPLDGSGVGAYTNFIYGDETYPYGSKTETTISAITTSNESHSISSHSYNSTTTSTTTLSAETNFTEKTVAKTDFGDIELVGVFSSVHPGNATAHTYTSLPGDLIDGDMIFVFNGVSDADGATAEATVVESGYTAGPQRYSYDTYDAGFESAYYFVSGSYSNTIEIEETGDAKNPRRVIGFIFRGVDQVTTLGPTASAIQASNIICPIPSITPTVAGSVIICAHVCSHFDNAVGVMKNDSFDVVFSGSANDSVDVNLSIFIKKWEGGLFDPDNATSLTIDTSTSFCSAANIFPLLPA